MSITSNTENRPLCYNYMNRQIDSILSADWAGAFEKETMSFGKVDASFVIRKAFASLRSVV